MYQTSDGTHDSMIEAIYRAMHGVMRYTYVDLTGIVVRRDRYGVTTGVWMVAADGSVYLPSANYKRIQIRPVYGPRYCQ